MLRNNFIRNLSVITMMIVILGLPMGSMVNATTGTPINNLIVIMDDFDQAISDSVETLKEDLDQYKIVRYDSFEYYWTVGLKMIGNAILVCHGFEDKGVLVNGDLLTWEQYGNIANSINAFQIHFLNCGSSDVEDYVSNNKLGIDLTVILKQF